MLPIRSRPNSYMSSRDNLNWREPLLHSARSQSNYKTRQSTFNSSWTTRNRHRTPCIASAFNGLQTSYVHAHLRYTLYRVLVIGHSLTNLIFVLSTTKICHSFWTSISVPPMSHSIPTSLNCLFFNLSLVC